ncbi:MAG: radical SAM protein [Chloroflexi bacterium]|nr:radical SAM protein [Chloroflexota bacterium]MCL5109148.1 radical SAM protein [Chloroflexota bacterium]
MGLTTETKIDLLAEGAGFDVCQAAPGASPLRHDDLSRWLYPAVVSGGRVVNLFKVLLSNVCFNDCSYCANRRDSACRRASLGPEELVRSFLELHRRGRAQGLFLSSALAGSGPATMDRLLAAVEHLRLREGFRGYIHLKIMPGAEREAVARAVQLADRVSINLEAPNPSRLAGLSNDKNFAELLQRLRWAHELRRESGGAPSGLTTQYVVGAAGESDAELLATSGRLYREVGLARAYYSAFRPLPGTPLEGLPATSPRRELRLYQADFLLRSYGYRADEMVVDGDGNLPQNSDPKVAWARAHPERFPVDIQTAGRSQLLRVPGIGPRGAEAILAARRQARLRDPRQLRALGIAAGHAAPYVLLDGKQPASARMRQASLWTEDELR